MEQTRTARQPPATERRPTWLSPFARAQSSQLPQVVVDHIPLAGRHIVTSDDVVHIVNGLVKPASIIASAAQFAIDLAQVPRSVFNSLVLSFPASETRSPAQVPQRSTNDGAVAAVALCVNRRLLPHSAQQNHNKESYPFTRLHM